MLSADINVSNITSWSSGSVIAGFRSCDTGIVSRSSSYSGSGHFGTGSASSPDCKMQTTPSRVCACTYGIPFTSAGHSHLLFSQRASGHTALHCSEYWQPLSPGFFSVNKPWGGKKWRIPKNNFFLPKNPFSLKDNTWISVLLCRQSTKLCLCPC